MGALPWISPADADDMLYDDPDGSGKESSLALGSSVQALTERLKSRDRSAPAIRRRKGVRVS